MADSMEDTMAGTMGDTVIMADLFSALAQDFGRDIFHGITHGIIRDTITITHPLLLTQFLLDMLSLHQLPKILVRVLSSLLPRLVRSHPTPTKDDVKSGHPPVSFIMSRAGMQRNRLWKPFQSQISLGRIIPVNNPLYPEKWPKHQEFDEWDGWGTSVPKLPSPMNSTNLKAKHFLPEPPFPYISFNTGKKIVVTVIARPKGVAISSLLGIASLLRSSQ
jgi:hypothetical protein